MFGLDFSNPKLSPAQITGAISEAGVCLLSGETTGLTYMPVDGDPRNILPSNVACISTDVAKQIKCHLGYGRTFLDFQVNLESPLLFAEYNYDALVSASEAPQPPAELPIDERLLLTFRLLAKAHVKGVRSISTGGYTLTWKQFQNHLVSASRVAASSISRLSL